MLKEYEPEDEILRIHEVRRITKLSRTTMWRYEKEGKFPDRRIIGVGKVGWIKSEVITWMKTLTKVKDDPSFYKKRKRKKGKRKKL